MTKIEMAIQSTEWKIEEAEKTIEEMRRNIKQSIDSKNLGCEASFILSYAMKMDEAAKKLAELKETLEMLNFLAEEK
jgi:Ni,Fe-hydrogenase I large subunit|nr:MAG TPA: hypothetical protein [Caudoviricetes sp.]